MVRLGNGDGCIECKYNTLPHYGTLYYCEKEREVWNTSVTKIFIRVVMGQLLYSSGLSINYFNVKINMLCNEFLGPFLFKMQHVNFKLLCCHGGSDSQ